MTWVEVLAAFLVAHLVGDYLLQTDWQARHKAGGLGGDRTARKALVAHVATYTLAFVPACVWIGGERGVGWAVLTGALVALPHPANIRPRRLRQDDVRGPEYRAPPPAQFRPAATTSTRARARNAAPIATRIRAGAADPPSA